MSNNSVLINIKNKCYNADNFLSNLPYKYL